MRLKAIVFSTLMLCVSALFAVTDAEIQDLQNRVTCLEHRPITPSYQCAENGWGVIVIAQPLLWKVNQDGLDYAITAHYDLTLTPQSPGISRMNLDLTNGKSHQPNFKWDWGFRVGLGYQIPYDGWDTNVAWTRFYHSASDSVSRDGDPNVNNFAVGGPTVGEFISPFWVAELFSPPGLMNRAKALWNLHLDLLDAELGRKFFVSKFLVLRPFISLRSGWISQKYRIAFLAFDWPDNPGRIGRDIQIKMKNNFWGMGGRGGIGSQWILGKGFSICAQAALSLLYGTFDTSYRLHDQKPFRSSTGLTGLSFAGIIPVQSISGPYDDTFEVKNHYQTTVYMTDLFLGVCWDKSFHNNRFCISIWAGYEQNIFFQQNRFINPQYDFTLVDLTPAIQGGNEGPNFFVDRGSMSTGGGSGGVSFSF